MLIVGKSGFLSSSWHRFAFFFSFCPCHHSQGRCWRPTKMLWNSLRYNIGNPTATPCLGLQIPVPQTRQQGGFSATLHPAQELKLWPSLTQLTERKLGWEKQSWVLWSGALQGSTSSVQNEHLPWTCPLPLLPTVSAATVIPCWGSMLRACKQMEKYPTEPRHLLNWCWRHR